LSYNRQIGRGIVYGGVREDDMVSLVILRSVNNFIGIQVDQVIGEQEIVIKQLEGPIPKPTGIAGATVLGDGRIMPIGDVLELIDLAQGRIRKDSSSMLWQQAPIPSKPESDSVKTEPMVLIVDDSITVRELLSLSFNKAGYRVEQARDGMEAWDKLRSGLPCDLIFCDIEMPRMDGLELLSRLQQDEELRGIPMAMLTSRGAQRHRQMASDMGAKAYFTNPYLEEALLDAAQRMLQGDDLLNQTRRPETPATAPPSVLIIDDSVTVRELLSMTFQKAGYQVEQARDGQDAWEKLNSEKHFDLVFCDIEMPRMDGLELLSHLNQDEKLNKVPVAMLTSRGAQKHRKIAADRGAKGYFTKPYVEDVLIDAAKRMRDGEVLLESES
ncbi:MAG: response regulator, partial [Cyanobacteriota bacterium]